MHLNGARSLWPAAKHLHKSLQNKVIDMFEFMTKKKWLTVLAIILIITVLRTMIQPLIPDDGSNPLPKSWFVSSGLMPIAFIIYGLVMLGLLALVFVAIQSLLPGKKLRKGATFGIAFGGLWFVYLLELLPHAPWQLPSSLFYPIVDGITIALLGLLLGRFVAADSESHNAVANRLSIALTAIPAMFLIGRLINYNIFHIYSLYSTRPIETLLWVVIMGTWISIMYTLLQPSTSSKSLLAKAIFFGLIVFGINIFLNDMFMPIPFTLNIWGIGAFSYEDMILRTGVDILSVTAGVCVYEILYNMASSPPSTKGSNIKT